MVQPILRVLGEGRKMVEQLLTGWRVPAKGLFNDQSRLSVIDGARDVLERVDDLRKDVGGNGEIVEGVRGGSGKGAGDLAEHFAVGLHVAVRAAVEVVAEGEEVLDLGVVALEVVPEVVSELGVSLGGPGVAPDHGGRGQESVLVQLQQRGVRLLLRQVPAGAQHHHHQGLPQPRRLAAAARGGLDALLLVEPRVRPERELVVQLSAKVRHGLQLLEVRHGGVSDLGIGFVGGVLVFVWFVL